MEGRLKTVFSQSGSAISAGPPLEMILVFVTLVIV